MKLKIKLAITTLFLIILTTGTISALTGIISPARFVIRTNQGEIVEKYISIKNPNNSTVNIELNSSADPGVNITLINKTFSLNSNETKKAFFKIKSNEIGTKEGKINIRFSKTKENITLTSRITLIIEEKTSFVEITAYLDPPQPIEGQQIIVIASLKNTGSEKTNYNILAYDYSDWADLISINPISLVLEPEESNDSRITLNLKNNSAGYHEFIIKTSYNNKTTEQAIALNVFSNSTNQNPDTNQSVNLTQINQRLTILESWKLSITSWKNSITDTINSLLTAINNHETRIEALENKTQSQSSKNYLKYLSSTDRKNMVCGYAQDNHLTHIEDLGLICDITYRTLGTKERASCKCK